VREYGFGYANGDYIAMHDSDDWSVPHRLRMSVDYIKATGADFLHADFIKVMPDGKQSYYSAGAFTPENVTRGGTSAFGTVLVKKDLLKKFPMPVGIPYCNEPYLVHLPVAETNQNLASAPAPLLLQNLDKWFSLEHLKSRLSDYFRLKDERRKNEESPVAAGGP